MKSGPMKKPAASKNKFVPGTRIPISFLIDYIIEGYTIDEFMSAYPWVKKSNIKKSLREFQKKEYPLSNAF